jgi:radical SAM protein with 4Fe4S-binding SPASM domain
VQLETTGECNLRCIMCPTTYNPTHASITEEVFAPILEAAPHVEAVIPYLGGEPMLHHMFFPILERLRERVPGLFLGFNTNGTLLDDEACQRLVKLRINEIVVSMDGARAETYNKIRIRSDFDKVTANIRRLVDARGNEPAPRLGTLFVATRKNVEEVPEIVRLAASLGLTKVLINGIEPYTKETAELALYAKDPEPRFVALFEEAQQEAARHNIQLLSADLKATGERLYCPALSVCLVRANGEVYPCYQYATDDPFYYHGNPTHHLGPLSFGNVKEQSLYEIWNSPAYREFREALRQRRFHPECQHCLVAEGLACNVQIYRV